MSSFLRALAQYLRCCQLIGLLLTCLYTTNTLASQADILVLGAAPVQAGKLERLKPLAQQYGFSLEYRMLDGLKQPLTSKDLQGYQLLLVDAPYGASKVAAQRLVAPLLEHYPGSWIWLRRDGSIGKGFPEALISQLDLYYSNGGKQNFAGFFCRLGNQINDNTNDCADELYIDHNGHSYSLRLTRQNKLILTK